MPSWRCWQSRFGGSLVLALGRHRNGPRQRLATSGGCEGRRQNVDTGGEGIAQITVVGEPGPVRRHLTWQVVDVDRLAIEGELDGDVLLEGLAVGKAEFKVADPEKDPLPGRGLKRKRPGYVGPANARERAFVEVARGLRRESDVGRRCQ